MTFRLLILGGSSEGFALAEKLAGNADMDIITSFAGRTLNRRNVPGRSRIGGFGGAEGLADYLGAEKISALIDATHPFAARIKQNATAAAARTGTPLLHVLRQPWRTGAGDDWRFAANMDEAAAMLSADMAPVFLTVGRTELAPFARVRNVGFLARIIDPPEAGAEMGAIETLQARGPFRLKDERRLFEERGIGCLVTKNSGGEAAGAKLQVAREKGIPVIMVRRPEPPQGRRVETIAEAIIWLEDLRHGRH